jgi:FKBP-type peptidyl-prolyl cis-trans isomerase
MKKLETREWIGVTVAVIAAITLFFGNTIWNSLFKKQPTEQPVTSLINSNPTGTSTQSAMKNISTTAGLEIYDMNVGTGAEAVAGKKVTAHYVGTLTDGTKFDSSLDRGQPFEFNLGAGQVIKGWDVSIAGMKVGGIRTLVIAPEFGYGAQAIGSIPANSTLVFQVQLLEVK